VYRRRAYRFLWWYCSRTCAKRLFGHRARRRRAEERQSPELHCAVCGKAFTPARADARTCSAACRQKAHRQRVTDRKLLARCKSSKPRTPKK
jgi:predicted nucleic acid-binding Zn ribbon protein